MFEQCYPCKSQKVQESKPNPVITQHGYKQTKVSSFSEKLKMVDKKWYGISAFFIFHMNI